MTISDRKSITYENFVLESRNILSELDIYHESKKRSIDHCFQILFDNLPKEIKNTSINKIYDNHMNSIDQKSDNNDSSEDVSEEIDITEF